MRLAGYLNGSGGWMRAFDASGRLDVNGSIRSITFPPRDEAFRFRQALEVKYRDDLGRRPTSSHVDIEGAVVWTQEYLRYRVNGCGHAEAESKVLSQIRGGGIAPVCSDDELPFPPRNEAFDFRNRLERLYRDELRRSPKGTHVDLEGDIVWTQEYLRYRVSACPHAFAQGKVFDQIDGRGVQPACASDSRYYAGTHSRGGNVRVDVAGTTIDHFLLEDVSVTGGSCRGTVNRVSVRGIPVSNGRFSESGSVTAGDVQVDIELEGRFSGDRVAGSMGLHISRPCSASIDLTYAATPLTEGRTSRLKRWRDRDAGVDRGRTTYEPPGGGAETTMPRRLNLGAAVAFAACWLVPVSEHVEAQSDGLFSAVEATQARSNPRWWIDPAADALPHTLRSRLVRIDFGKLDAARAVVGQGLDDPAPLTLNLFDDTVFGGRVEWSAPTQSGYVLSGHLDGEPFGTVNLAVNGAVVVGTVRTLQGTWRVRSAGAGLHLIRQVDLSTLPPRK